MGLARGVVVVLLLILLLFAENTSLAFASSDNTNQLSMNLKDSLRQITHLSRVTDRAVVVGFLQEGIASLISTVSGLQVDRGLQASLLNSLQQALNDTNRAAESVLAGHARRTDDMLNATDRQLSRFADEVREESGRRISSAEAATLVASAQTLIQDSALRGVYTIPLISAAGIGEFQALQQEINSTDAQIEGDVQALQKAGVSISVVDPPGPCGPIPLNICIRLVEDGTVIWFASAEVLGEWMTAAVDGAIKSATGHGLDIEQSSELTTINVQIFVAELGSSNSANVVELILNVADQAITGTPTSPWQSIVAFYQDPSVQSILNVPVVGPSEQSFIDSMEVQMGTIKLTLNPTSGSVSAGSAVPPIVVTVYGGVETVDLTVTGLPSGATASYPATLGIKPAGVSTFLSLFTSSSTPAGTYGVVVTALGSVTGFTQTFTLTVTSPPPPPPPSQALAPWTPTTPFPEPDPSGTGDVPCVSWDAYSYCVLANGGAYFAPLSSSGIGSWESTTSYPDSVLPVCVADNGFIYCISTACTTTACTNLPANAWFAPLSSSGIGAWVQTTSYPLDANSKIIEPDMCVVVTHTIYCVTGMTYESGPVNNVYIAPLSASGIGAWIAGPSYPFDGIVGGCTDNEGSILCVGGSNIDMGVTTNAVYSLAAGGVAWQPLSNYPLEVGVVAVVSLAGTAYVLPGPINCCGDGTSVYRLSDGAWVEDTPYPITVNVLWSQNCVTNSNFLYCMNGRSSSGEVITSAYFTYVP